MRKIETREEKEKRETRNKTIIGLLLVVVMVLSTVGYSFFSRSEMKIEKIRYKGVEFVLNEDNLWRFKMQNYMFSTTYNPKDTENISVSVFKTINEFYGKPLYYVGGGEVLQELIRNLGAFVLRMQSVCLEGESSETCEENAPIKNCSSNIIIIEEANYTMINQKENCVFIKAPYEEQVKAVDAFLFKIMGL